MRDIITGIIKYGEFQKSINLELFHAMLSMIAHVSEKEDALRQWRRLRNSVIWWECREDYESYFKSSGLRYPGEVLERYEEQFGSEIRNLRAVALALGYATPFLTSDMFIGRQKEDFLRRLMKEANQDVYLLGARYLLESNPSLQQAMLKEMTSREYTKTEEALFVLSLYMNRTEGFQAMLPQLARLWGEGHTVSLTENAGMLEWLVAEYEEEIRKCRKKDCAVLKALTKLAYQHAKEESQVYSVLSKAGYKKAEIAYANSALVWTDRIYGSLDEDGMTAERIAADCCAALINSDSPLEESMYSYLEYLLKKYSRFKIKYEGNKGIEDAIGRKIMPVVPQIVLWMLQNTNIRSVQEYRFDVFDTKWEILQQRLDERQYQELFTWQMINQKDLSKSEAERWLERYRKLTGKDFLTCFQYSWSHNQKCFALLVRLKVISLWDFFQEHKKELLGREDSPQEISYIWGYVKAIGSREAYEFMCLFLQVYGLSGITTYFGVWKCLHDSMVWNLENYHREDVRIAFYRDFLSVEENRQLFEWLDESVFRRKPSKYSDFVVAALKNVQVQEIYPKEELKLIFKELLSRDAVKYWDAKALKEIFYTQEELDAEKALLEAQKAEDARKKEEEELNKVKESLAEHSDGTFSSLRHFLDQYRYWKEDRMKAFGVSEEYFAELAVTRKDACDSSEFAEFLSICGDVIRLNALSQTKVLQLLEMMIRRGYYVADA